MNALKFKVPYVDLSVKPGSNFYGTAMNAFSDILKSGQFVLGRHVISFENKIANSVACNYAVGVNSGTDAIFFALFALGIGDGEAGKE